MGIVVSKTLIQYWSRTVASLQPLGLASPTDLLSTGAQARSLFKDAPRTKWESALDSFWQTLNKVEEAADDATLRMRDSEIGKELE